MKIGDFIKNLAYGATMAIMFAAGPVVRAGPIDHLHTIGFAKGYQSFGLSIGGSNVPTGGFHGTWNSEDITFWCIELTQYFGFSHNYSDYKPSPGSDATMTLLGRLFAEAFGDALTSRANSAAFQLAIWEIVNDGSSLTNLDLGAGTFRVLNNRGNVTAVAQAQTWLRNLGQFSDTYDLVLLRSPSHQDFVTFGESFPQFDAPEPVPFALILLGLVAMGVVRRVADRRASA